MPYMRFICRFKNNIVAIAELGDLERLTPMDKVSRLFDFVQAQYYNGNGS